MIAGVLVPYFMQYGICVEIVFEWGYARIPHFSAFNVETGSRAVEMVRGPLYRLRDWFHPRDTVRIDNFSMVF
jgi:hypothetical protein